MDKRPIAETLRHMRKGRMEAFPISQYNSCRATVATGLVDKMEQGWAWKVRLNRKDGIVEVRRTS